MSMVQPLFKDNGSKSNRKSIAVDNSVQIGDS